jgi:protein-tyrosine phosphatase
MNRLVRVLFVCLGNICRSPTAHGVFEVMVREAGLDDRIEVDSSGTGAWHLGSAPDQRAVAEAKGRGYDLSHLRARQVCAEDFGYFDLIIAMDHSNLADLKAMQPADSQAEVRLFLEFAGDADVDEVPDPYYGGTDGFARVFALVETASQGLLVHIREQYLRDLPLQEPRL